MIGERYRRMLLRGPEGLMSQPRAADDFTTIRTRMEETARAASDAFSKWLATRASTVVNSPLEDKAEIFYADPAAYTSEANKKIGVNVDLIASNIPGRQALHIRKPPVTPPTAPKPAPAPGLTAAVKPPDGVQIPATPKPAKISATSC